MPERPRAQAEPQQVLHSWLQAQQAAAAEGLDRCDLGNKFEVELQRLDGHSYSAFYRCKAAALCSLTG